ncbi:hypothetical protein C8R48DRAFT_732076 [Suillus tomentosus]|nr:hypothetical protein C8R48DRAFT_732076 [Suillus tomentosus]
MGTDHVFLSSLQSLALCLRVIECTRAFCLMPHILMCKLERFRFLKSTPSNRSFAALIKLPPSVGLVKFFADTY